jgi:nitrogen fixation/metabolism regulation signal transduction histidine kinase
MQLLKLLSRVAFICNICFLLASFIQWLPHPPEGEIVSLVILLGYLLSIFVNVVVNLWVLALLAARRLRVAAVPVWLLIVNFIFFALQLTLLLINRNS